MLLVYLTCVLALTVFTVQSSPVAQAITAGYEITQKQTRWTFDGLYYDDLEFANTDSATFYKLEGRNCMGEYFRCILSVPYLQQMCVLSKGNTLRYYKYTIHSFCDYEYYNCRFRDPPYKGYYEWELNQWDPIRDGACLTTEN